MKTSKDPRHLARRLALQALFAFTANQRLVKGNQAIESPHWQQLEKIFHHLQLDQPKSSKIDYDLAKSIMQQVAGNCPEYDTLISQAAPEWPLEQISLVDLSILHIAIAELSQNNRPPHKVIIDEAVELAKEFGGENSSKFVNGVLGTVVEKLKIEEKSDDS